MLVAALLALTPATGMPGITVKASGNGYIAKAETFEFSQSEAVESDVARRAADLCAGKDVQWGKFGSLTALGRQPGATPPPKVSGYYKEFRCIVAEQRVFPPAPDDWKASIIDEADVRRFFDLYYAKRDAGNLAAANAMFQPGESDQESSADDLRAFNKKLGPGSRRVTAVTWYVNPPTAEHPGVYAALDFVGDYPTHYFYCGYIGLYRRGPGAYEIVRVEQNMFERSNEPPDQAVLTQMREAACRGI